MTSTTPVWNMGRPCAPGAKCALCAARGVDRDGTEIDWNGKPLCSSDEHYDPSSGTEYFVGECESCGFDSTKLLPTNVGYESTGFDRLRLCPSCRTPKFGA